MENNDKPHNQLAYPHEEAVLEYNSSNDKWEDSGRRIPNPGGTTLLDLYAKDAPEVPDWFEYRRNPDRALRSTINQEDAIERLVAWRFYYATEMLKQRQKHI